MIIEGVTEDPDRLIGGGLMKGEYGPDVLPIEALHLGITIYHRIVPIGKLVPQGIKVEPGHKQNQKGDGKNREVPEKTSSI